MLFKSVFKNKEIIKFDENGYSNYRGYSDYKVIGHRQNEVDSFIWVNKDKKTIRIQALINNKFEFVTLWGSKLVYFKIQDWPASENKQKQLIKELLLSDNKSDFLDNDWREIVIQTQWELIVEFIENLNFQH
ncbi:TPA: hypothetical protein ACSVZR_003216 [Bacillus cereus]